MNKTEAFVKIKELIDEYKKTDDPYVADEALEQAFSLRDKYDIDINIMSIQNYHMTLICNILPYFYCNSELSIYAELKIPQNIVLTNLKIGDKVKIRFLQKTANHLGQLTCYLNDKYTTLMNSPKMDNLFKLRDQICSDEFKYATSVITINIPELDLFIKRLSDYRTSFSGGIRIIK